MRLKEYCGNESIKSSKLVIVNYTGISYEIYGIKSLTPSGRFKWSSWYGRLFQVTMNNCIQIEQCQKKTLTVLIAKNFSLFPKCRVLINFTNLFMKNDHFTFHLSIILPNIRTNKNLITFLQLPNRIYRRSVL